jgi:hypothetical protein
MGDSADAKTNRDRLRTLKDRYPMARMFLGLALIDQTDAKEKAEGIQLLAGLHDLDPLTLQTIVSSFYFMSPTNADADKAARQMLEAYMIALPAMEATKEPLMQGAPFALATMLEEGRGGAKDVARATEIYGDVVSESHPSCEPDAAAALQRLGKPVPEGRGPVCTGVPNQMQ